jgi:hypothetical protein
MPVVLSEETGAVKRTTILFGQSLVAVEWRASRSTGNYAWRMPFPIIAMRCSTLLPSSNSTTMTRLVAWKIHWELSKGGALPRRFYILRVRVGVGHMLRDDENKLS